MNKAEILDCTLRDGSYVLNYNFNQFETSLISRLLFEAGINYVEVGHGMGIGASLKSGQGQSFCSDEEYIEAASCLGLSNSRIIWKHLLPNSISPLIVLATLQTAHSISIEATLSFLGVGVPITEPSLGSLISNGFDFILSGAYWITFFPGIMLLATVASINVLGDQVRTILNPRFTE